MESDPNARPTLEVYKGRQLILTPIRKDDDTWVCEYVIIELGAKPTSTRGVSEGTFHSPNGARVAAILAAETLINARAATSEAERSPGHAI